MSPLNHSVLQLRAANNLLRSSVIEKLVSSAVFWLTILFVLEND